MAILHDLASDLWAHCQKPWVYALSETMDLGALSLSETMGLLALPLSETMGL